MQRDKYFNYRTLHLHYTNPITAEIPSYSIESKSDESKEEPAPVSQDPGMFSVLLYDIHWYDYIGRQSVRSYKTDPADSLNRERSFGSNRRVKVERG